MSIQSYKWIPSFVVKIIYAVNVSGVYLFQIQDSFIPLAEVYKPYNLPDLSDSEAVKALIGSNIADLVQSYASLNIDFTLMLMSPVSVSHRFFDSGNLIVSGDALLVLVPVF